MLKRLSIVVPAAIGGLLLAACGTDTAASVPPTATTASSTVDMTSSTPDSTATGGRLEPVNCGEVTLGNGAVHGVIAIPAAHGIVGCTEACSVIDEFLGLPRENRGEAALGDVRLTSGWSCTADDGVSANISCVKDKVGDEYGLALRTEQQAGQR